MENKQSKLSILTRGIIKENPVLVLILGTCPTLATTTGAINGLGMGVSTMVVLICSNIIISLLKNIIPDKVRIPCYIVVIATFVTIVQLMLKAFLPELDSALGLYIPLIVVNVCEQKFGSGFSSRWHWNGSGIYAGALLYGSGKRASWSRDVIWHYAYS